MAVFLLLKEFLSIGLLRFYLQRLAVAEPSVEWRSLFYQIYVLLCCFLLKLVFGCLCLCFSMFLESGGVCYVIALLVQGLFLFCLHTY